MEDQETWDETWDQYLRYSKVDKAEAEAEAERFVLVERLKQASSDLLGRVTVLHQLFSLGLSYNSVGDGPTRIAGRTAV
jgi:hypothetical protein